MVALTYWPWQWSLAPHEDEEVDEDGLRLSSIDDDCSNLGMSAINFWTNIMDVVDWQARLRRCLLLAALACVLRPTNILIWICISSFALFRVVTYGRIVHIPWFGTPVWLNVTDLSLYPATRQERWILLREAAICG